MKALGWWRKFRNEGGALTISFFPFPRARFTEVTIERAPAPHLKGIGLSEDAKEALKRAYAEAERLRHDSVGTEHLLLGILREMGDALANLLSALSVEVAVIEKALEPGKSRRVAEEGMIEEELQEALSSVAEMAHSFNIQVITPEILLLVLCQGPDYKARKTLQSVGYDPDLIAGEVRSLLIS